MMDSERDSPATNRLDYAPPPRPPEYNALAIIAGVLGAISGPIASILDDSAIRWKASPVVFALARYLPMLIALVIANIGLWQISESENRPGGETFARAGIVLAGFWIIVACITQI